MVFDEKEEYSWKRARPESEQVGIWEGRFWAVMMWRAKPGQRAAPGALSCRFGSSTVVGD